MKEKRRWTSFGNSPFRATLIDAFRETQFLQTSGKSRLCINPRVKAFPTEPSQRLCLEKRDRQDHQEGDDLRSIKIQKYMYFNFCPSNEWIYCEKLEMLD